MSVTEDSGLSVTTVTGFNYFLITAFSCIRHYYKCSFECCNDYSKQAIKVLKTDLVVYPGVSLRPTNFFVSVRLNASVVHAHSLCSKYVKDGKSVKKKH